VCVEKLLNAQRTLTISFEEENYNDVNTNEQLSNTFTQRTTAMDSICACSIDIAME